MSYRISKIQWTSAFVLLAFLFQGKVFADEAQLVSMIQTLQDQMKQMQRRIDRQSEEILELKQNRAQVQIAAPSGETPQAGPRSDYEFNRMLDTSTGGAQKWLKDLSLKGDLRLRYEAFENHSGAATEDDDRNRFRYRLRYGFEKKFHEDMKIGFSMASGEFPTMAGTTAGSAVAQNDPTATNTTFDNNFDFKPIYIEKAFASYSPFFLKNKGPLKATTVIAGKMDNAFEKGSSDIVWDRDVKPEGIMERLDFNLIDGSKFDLGSYFTAGQFVLDEDSDSSAFAGDAELYAFQLGLQPVFYLSELERPVEVLSAFSYYSYNDYATNGNFTIGGTSLARGNSNNAGSADDLDAQDFEVVEIYNEITVTPMGCPVRPYFDWVRNAGSASDEDAVNNLGVIGNGEEEAWAFGLKLGGIVKKGDWEASYAYKRIGANAVPGFNDGDFGFSGHSAKRGSIFRLGYGITDNIVFNSTAFFVNNLNPGTSTIIDQEQRRFQVDLVWKF